MKLSLFTTMSKLFTFTKVIFLCIKAVVCCLSPVLWCTMDGAGLFVSRVIVYHGWWWFVCLLGNGVSWVVVVCLSLG